MDYAITLKLGLLALLLAFSGFFSGSEASFFSLTTLHLYKMKEERFPLFATVHKLLAHPRRLLVTVLVGNESINVAFSALMTSLFIFFFGLEGKWGAIALTTVLLLIFGESIPKTFAVTHPMSFSSIVSLPLTLFARILFPVVWLLEKISDFFVFISVRTSSESAGIITEDEFRTLVDVGHEEGALDGEQKELIHRIFELGDIKVSDVMTPRVDMFCLPLSMSIRDMEEEIIAARHSRIPIYGTDKDDLLGILHAKDLLSELSKGRKKFNVRALLRKPYFVPTEKEAHTMLGDFKAKQLQMGIVVDEYGGVAGLVTLTDIMESIFGEMYDEYALREEMIHTIDERTFIVSGMMDVEDFNKRFGIRISTDDFDTVGGFVFHLFGKLPVKGEEVDYEGYRFTVESIRKARILTLRVTETSKE